MSEAKLIPVSGRKTPTNGTAGVWSWQPDGELIGTVVYVHGMFDSADSAWEGKLGKYGSASYKRPNGKALQPLRQPGGVQSQGLEQFLRLFARGTGLAVADCRQEDRVAADDLRQLDKREALGRFGCSGYRGGRAQVKDLFKKELPEDWRITVTVATF